MTDQDKKSVTELLSRCVSCGKPTTKGNNFCRECIDRGLGPCEACEGLSLLEIEENAS